MKTAALILLEAFAAHVEQHHSKNWAAKVAKGKSERVETIGFGFRRHRETYTLALGSRLSMEASPAPLTVEDDADPRDVQRALAAMLRAIDPQASKPLPCWLCDYCFITWAKLAECRNPQGCQYCSMSIKTPFQTCKHFVPMKDAEEGGSHE